MTFLRYADFLAQLKRPPTLPVYCFCGEERYLKEKAVALLAQTIQKQQPNIPVECRKLRVTQDSIPDILSQALEMPLFSGFKILVLEEAEKIPPSHPGFSDYLKNPNPNACMVLLSNEKKPNPNHPLLSHAPPKGQIVQFWPLSENEAVRWIQEEVRCCKKTIGPAAAQMLVQEAGPGLENLSKELDKLCLYTGKRNEATLQDVQHSLGSRKTFQIFDLQRAVSAADAARSLKILRNLSEQSAEPVYLLIRGIYDPLHKQLKAKVLQHSGMPETSIHATLKLHRFYDADFFSHLSRKSVSQITQAIRWCSQADVELKTGGQTSAQWVLEELILRICQAAEAPEGCKA